MTSFQRCQLGKAGWLCLTCVPKTTFCACGWVGWRFPAAMSGSQLSEIRVRSTERSGFASMMTKAPERDTFPGWFSETFFLRGSQGSLRRGDKYQVSSNILIFEKSTHGFICLYLVWLSSRFYISMCIYGYAVLVANPKNNQPSNNQWLKFASSLFEGIPDVIQPKWR